MDRRSWRPGLDGLRAIAVIAVIAYHLAPDSWRGGFLGVSMFFTLSGYLITSLLLAEFQEHGRISLSQFWSRRARRLWPLSWLTFAGVALAGALGVWGADAGARLPGELAASLGQFANWWQLTHNGYVNLFGRLSPLRHIWSLAIEEQFYLVWPALVWLTARRRSALGLLIVVGIAGSAISTYLNSGAPDRIYLGTDTRAAELLGGALLAVLWQAHPLTGVTGRAAKFVLNVASLAAVAAIGAAMYRFRPDDPIWGRGGFFAITLCSLVLVANSVTDGPMAKLLALPPIAWIGRRSYAIYLIHWPVWVGLPIAWNFWFRVAFTVLSATVGAEVLHLLLERPVRERRMQPQIVTALGLAALAFIFAGGILSSSDGGAEQAVAHTLGQVADPTTTVTAPNVTTTTIPCPTTSITATTLGSYDETLANGSDPVVQSCNRETSVLVLGDSTARGLANGLRSLGLPNLVVWDRSVLHCSFGGEALCPNWRQTWADAVAQIHPDVVLVDVIPIAALDGQDPADVTYLSDAEAAHRTRLLTEAMSLLHQSGSRVVWMRSLHLEMPAALFYCKGRASDTMCDPSWVDRWNESVNASAVATNTDLLDVSGWAAKRPDPVKDRPDGVHFTGDALSSHAQFVADYLLGSTVTGR